MNTMNMPGFTANDSLYRTSGHYRSGRNRTGINLNAQANGPIHSQATDLDTVGEEVIIIEGTAPTPWGLPSGWGPGGWGGPHGGGGPVPTGPGGGGGSGSGSGGTKQPPKTPPPPKGQDKKGQKCERQEKNGSTFGNCESPTICKDKEVTRDALNNRWVCKV